MQQDQAGQVIPEAQHRVIHGSPTFPSWKQGEEGSVHPHQSAAVGKLFVGFPGNPQSQAWAETILGTTPGCTWLLGVHWANPLPSCSSVSSS